MAKPTDAELDALTPHLHHEHAVALASACAIVEGIGCVLWQKDLRYAWV